MRFDKIPPTAIIVGVQTRDIEPQRLEQKQLGPQQHGGQSIVNLGVWRVMDAYPQNFISLQTTGLDSAP